MTQIVSAVVEEMARLIQCVTGFGPDGAVQVTKVIRYTFKGNNSAIFIFAFLLDGSQL